MDFKFSQWGSHSERVLTFNMNIQHPLFWSIWRWGRGLTSNDDLKCQLHKSFKASISNPGQWGLSFEIFFFARLDFCIFNRPAKNSNSRLFTQGFQRSQKLTQNLYSLLIRMQSSSLSPTSAPSVYLAFTPNSYTRRQSKFLTAM